MQNLKVQAICKWDDQLIVGTDDGIFFLTEHSKTWSSANVNTQVLSIYQYDRKLVSGTSQGTLLSTDQGATWNWIRKEGAVHYTQNIGPTIIELVLNGDLVFSDNWGKDWTHFHYEPRAGSYVYKIIQSGNYLLFSNNYGIHRSQDHGKSWEHLFKTEAMAFFDLMSVGDAIYGGTRDWDEYRKRNH